MSEEGYDCEIEGEYDCEEGGADAGWYETDEKLGIGRDEELFN